MRGALGIIVATQAFAAVSCKQDAGPDCDRARELLAADMKKTAAAAIEHAPTEQQAALQASADGEVARAHARFHDLCVALPADARGCISRLGEVLAAQRHQRQGAELDAELARCVQSLEPFMAKLYAE